MREMKKVLIAFLVLGAALLTSNCHNEEIDTGQLSSQDPKIAQAKEWFESYKSNSTTGKIAEGEFNQAFINLDYYWENAKVAKLDGNSTGIAVPVKDNPEAPDYKGQKMLYLRESGSRYEAILQEIFPDSKEKITDEQKRQGFGDLSLFSGYILNWDLKEGFLKGARLKDGLVVADVIDVLTLFGEDASESNTAKMIEMFDEQGIGSERDDTLQRGGGTAAIPLKNVIVEQKSPPRIPKDFSIAGAFGDGGSGGNSGTPTGGGSNGSGDTASVATAPPSCQSFNFTSRKGANWQEALVKNINFRIVLITLPNHIQITQVISFPQAVSFGMPIEYNKGNGDVSSGVAATVSARILQLAMDETVAKFGRTTASELTVRLYFQEKLMKEYRDYTNGGIVNFNANSNIPATQYKTNALSSGNCD